MRQRTAAIVGCSVAVLALVVVGGFAVRNQPVACTASLALPTAPITLSGSTSLVRGVEVCGLAACTFASVASASPTPTPTPGPDGLVTGDPNAPLKAYQVEKNEWTVGFPGDQPPTARIAVLGDGGRILVEKSFDLRWRQIGKTSVCGNGHTTQTLRVAVPAP